MSDVNVSDPNEWNIESGGGNATPPGSEDFSDFGNQYLQGIPEGDREVVGRYVREWDGKVTQRFQDLQGEISGFTDIGDQAALQQAMAVVESLNGDPVAFRENLDAYIQQNAERYGQGVPQVGTEDLGLDEDQQAAFDAIQDQINMIGGTQVAEQERRNEIEESAMLDAALDEMHTEHGDFDDRWVTMQLAAGMTPSQAVDSFHKLSQEIVDSQQRTPPPNLMGGSGNGVPLDQVDKEALADPGTRKRIGAEFLKNQLG